MRRLSVLTILCAALALPGCLRPTDKTAPVDSLVRAGLHETLSPAGRTLEMPAATEKEYRCSNFTLLYRLTRLGEHVAIAFDGVSVPDICLTALGPARCRIPLGPTAEGAFPLTLNVEGMVREGQLVVTASTLELRGFDGGPVTIPRPLLRRVPPATIWGLVGWGPEDQSDKAKAFLDSLGVVGAQPVTLAAGDYDYFQVAEDGTVKMATQGGYYFSKAFAFHFEGDRAALPGVVSAFGAPLWIAVYDDLGNGWFNWATPATGPVARR